MTSAPDPTTIHCGRCGHLHTDGPDNECPATTPLVFDGAAVDEAACSCPGWQPEPPPPCQHCRCEPIGGEEHGQVVRLGPAPEDVVTVCLDNDGRAIRPLDPPVTTDPPF